MNLLNLEGTGQHTIKFLYNSNEWLKKTVNTIPFTVTPTKNEIFEYKLSDISGSLC